MSERIFIDTNVLVYLFDADSAEKQNRSREIIADEDIRSRIVISTQVLQEFYVAVTRKLAVPLNIYDAEKAVVDLSALPVVQVDVSMILSAIKNSRHLNFSFWDSLIIESAISAGAKILYTEDLQHGQTIDELQIINPYL